MKRTRSVAGESSGDIGLETALASLDWLGMLQLVACVAVPLIGEWINAAATQDELQHLSAERPEFVSFGIVAHHQTSGRR